MLLRGIKKLPLVQCHWAGDIIGQGTVTGMYILVSRHDVTDVCVIAPV